MPTPASWASTRARRRAVPGVVAAWSAADLPETARPILAGSGGAHKGRPFAVPVLARDLVRYVGEPVAVVRRRGRLSLSPTRSSAVDGRLRAAAGARHARGRARLAGAAPRGLARQRRGVAAAALGDVEQGLAEADGRRERAAPSRPRSPRVFIETRGALAYRDATPDGSPSGPPRRTPTRSATPSPRILAVARRGDARADARRRRRLRSQGRDLPGGDPGRRSPRSDWGVRSSGSRAGARTSPSRVTTASRSTRCAIGFRRDGTIVGIDASFLADVGAYPAQGDRSHAQHRQSPARALSRGALSRAGATAWSPTRRSTAPTAARGGPRPSSSWSALMDIGARRLGLDPAELRRRNLVRPDGDALPPGPDLQGRHADRLRPGRLPRLLRPRAVRSWATTSGARARRRAGPARAASASASPATRRARASAPTRARPSAWTRAARSTSSSA